MAESKAISIRVPDLLLEKIDRLAEEKYKSHKGTPNRSLVVLDAIVAYFDTLSDTGDTDKLVTVSGSVSIIEFNELQNIVNTLAYTIRQLQEQSLIMSDSVSEFDESAKKAISDRVSEIPLDSIAISTDKLSPVDRANEDTLEPQKTEDSSVDLSKLQGAHTLTWVAFLSAIGMEIERDKDGKLIQNVRLAKIAIDKARELSSLDWEYISLNRRFIQV